MHIVVDTNAVISDLGLKGTSIIKLSSKAFEQGYTLCFPEIVIEEMVKHYQQTIEKQLKEIRKATKKIFDDTSITVVTEKVLKSVENSSKNFKKQLKSRIKDLHGIILSHPSKEQQNGLIKKSVYRKKPFNENGKGYQDAIIWCNIMDLASKYIEDVSVEKPRIIFVTNNHTDFCNSDKFDLHNDLVDELEDESISSKVVIIVKSLDEASSQLLNHSETVLLEDTLKFLTSDKSLSLKSLIEKEILNNLPYKSLDNDEIGLGDAFEDPSIDMIHEDYEYGEVLPEILPGGEIAVNMKIAVTCTLDVFVSKSEAINLEETDGLSIYDYDWNNHYVAGQFDKKIWFNVNFISQSKFDEISNIEIEPDEDLNNLHFVNKSNSNSDI